MYTRVPAHSGHRLVSCTTMSSEVSMIISCWQEHCEKVVEKTNGSIRKRIFRKLAKMGRALQRNKLFSVLLQPVWLLVIFCCFT
ncbi:hypothetical protein AV530_002927 [Patagioenas fasciata monilis]|uniref:Uncharacterized protein n=1 Tax=Patagioenas fasciata monilis TaxID=372326 RepID=A0A1V4K9V5_PATFA|nr:hypothetical protein AV530_002927 [Patagioenas fasciata monilis]